MSLLSFGAIVPVQQYLATGRNSLWGLRGRIECVESDREKGTEKEEEEEEEEEDDICSESVAVGR